MRFTLAKRPPMRSSSCDECVGHAIQSDRDNGTDDRAPESLTSAAVTDVRQYNWPNRPAHQATHRMWLVNVLLPGCGTQQFTMCYEHAVGAQVVGLPEPFDFTDPRDQVDALLAYKRGAATWTTDGAA